MQEERSPAELQRQLDGLATRLLVNGTKDELAGELAQWSERACATGYPETARMASELAARAQDAAPNGESALGSGLARLQEVLEQEARGAAVPSRPAPEPGVEGGRAGTPPPAEPPAANSLNQDPELVRDFILEAREHLASIESKMLVLEQSPGDTEAIHSVFRGFHTIKGLAGFLEFAVIQEVAHDVETLLDRARNGKLAITSAVVDAVLAAADYLRQAVDAVEAGLSGQTPTPAEDHQPLLGRIRSLLSDASPQTTDQAASPVEEDPRAPATGNAAAAEGPAHPSQAVGATANSSGAFSVRVETSKLDYLLDMVGEMVIAQSLIRHNPKIASVQDSRLQGDLSQLARITGEVQRATMSMRMIPIGQLFQRTARLVRDLSRKAGKPVDLVLSGEETELDKTIAEVLADPLLHMVRNAIDHGIEDPETRRAAGKNPVARVRLAAYHQGGQIVVEVSDDGRGLDQEKILEKARQKGLIAEGAQLSETEIFHLIFEPGFSTADQVTDISGRGVGMDVVRRHVQQLRGRIDIQSTAGEGTVFFLKLPLTLAIIEGLVVVVGQYRYIVPIFAVREMFRPAPESVSTVQGRDEMALVRGHLLPVVRLHKRFGVKPRAEDPCQGLLVVSECEGKQFCLLVDDLVGKQEVVIKSLGETLKNIGGIAGGAILGDGRVGLILDMEGIFRGASHA